MPSWFKGLIFLFFPVVLAVGLDWVNSPELGISVRHLAPPGTKDSNSNVAERFLNARVFSRQVIEREQRLSSHRRTVVFDLDDCLIATDANESFPYPNIEEQFEQLKNSNIRLVLWTTSKKDLVQRVASQLPGLFSYFDLIITWEDFKYPTAEELVEAYPSRIDEIEEITKFYDNATKEGVGGGVGVKDISLIGSPLIVESDFEAAQKAGRFFGFQVMGFYFALQTFRTATQYLERFGDDYDLKLLENQRTALVPKILEILEPFHSSDQYL